MDKFEEIYERANRLAEEKARHDWMRSMGETSPRPTDADFGGAMQDVTRLFSNVTRFLAGDPDESSDEAVHLMSRSFMDRAEKELRVSASRRPRDVF
jgi:hypothetical protein